MIHKKTLCKSKTIENKSCQKDALIEGRCIIHYNMIKNMNHRKKKEELKNLIFGK